MVLPPFILGRMMLGRSGPSPKQTDPLMPLLFSIAIHTALEEAAAHLADGEQLCVFLDDVHVFCLPCRSAVQVVARVSGQSRRHQTPRRQNEGLEQERDCARGHRRTGRGGMAARRFEGSWHAHRVSAVHCREVARTSGRRTTLLGRYLPP